MNANLLQILLSPSVLAKPEPMTLTINFNHELQFRAVEIDDEMMHRLLPHELIAKHFSPLQMVPKEPLCKCAVVSKFPRVLLQIFAVEDFQDNPLTPFVKGELCIQPDN
jgi:hypothetical protein